MYYDPFCSCELCFTRMRLRAESAEDALQQTRRNETNPPQRSWWKRLFWFLPLLLLLFGCTTNQIVTSLRAVVSFAESIVKLLEAEQPPSRDMVKTYLASLAAATHEAADALAAPGLTDIQKAAAVRARFPKPLPPTSVMSPEMFAAVEKLNKQQAEFLKHFPTEVKGVQPAKSEFHIDAYSQAEIKRRSDAIRQRLKEL